MGHCLSSDSRFARTHPADPAPTMMWLYSAAAAAETEVENALLPLPALPLFDGFMKNDP